MLRQSKQAHTDNIANKLQADTLSSRSWLSILKSFISPSSKASIPKLDHNGRIYTIFFCEQTVLNDQNAALPDIV